MANIKSNGKRAAFCVKHSGFVFVEKDLYGKEHHFEGPGAAVGYRIAMRDKDVLALHALSKFMCYGVFTEAPPPEPLTDEEWKEIFSMEASANGTETIF